MSSIARWANKVVATIWRRGARNEAGGYVWSVPEYVLVSYQIGSSKEYVDSTGVKFVPKSTYWTEMLTAGGAFLPPLKVGDKIQLGELTGNPKSGAEDVRVMKIDGAEMFGAAEKPDYTVMT